MRINTKETPAEFIEKRNAACKGLVEENILAFYKGRGLEMEEDEALKTAVIAYTPYADENEMIMIRNLTASWGVTLNEPEGEQKYYFPVAIPKGRKGRNKKLTKGDKVIEHGDYYVCMFLSEAESIECLIEVLKTGAKCLPIMVM